MVEREADFEKCFAESKNMKKLLKRNKNKMIKNFIILSGILLSFVLLAGCKNTQQDGAFDGEESSEKSANTEWDDMAGSICYVKAGEKTGSGVILALNSDYVDVATAKHLIEECLYPEVTFINKESATGMSFFYSQQHDLAMIRIDRKACIDIHWEELSEAPLYLEAHPDDFFIEKKVDIIASKLEAAGNRGEGTISEYHFFAADFNDFVFLVEGTIEHGYSGGGVFLDDGFLLGMIIGGDGTYGACLPSEVIYEEYSSALQM